MPDPDRRTLSATETPALFGASPYVTRWTLYHKFASGLVIDGAEPNDRMYWGKAMQPAILQRVAADRKMEVMPNADDTYVRRGLLGCTRDATIICPDRGPGALEVKCVFDYATWMDKWQGGATVPRHYEIQLQQQMYVGDQSSEQVNSPYAWGLLAVWVCAELRYFERQPVPKLWDRLGREVDDFFADVEFGREPDAHGTAVEAPYITAMYPTRKDQVLDLSTDPDHVKTSEDVSTYQTHKETATGSGAVAEGLRIKLLALARDAEKVLLPCGVEYRIRKSGKGKSIVPYVPEHPAPPPPPKEIVGII